MLVQAHHKNSVSGGKKCAIDVKVQPIINFATNQITGTCINTEDYRTDLVLAVKVKSCISRH